MKPILTISFATVLLTSCAPDADLPPAPSERRVPEPTEVIDLGALVTEDLPERVWGKRHLSERGYSTQFI